MSEDRLALEDIRGIHGMILLFAPVGTLGYFWLILAPFSPTPMIWLLVFGLVAAAITVGLWFARDWARIVAALIPSMYGAWYGWAAVGLLAQGELDLGLGALGHVIGTGCIIWFALHPSMRRRFVQAREAIARTRATAT